MATVGDTFTEVTSNADLDAHTPTGANAGTSWVKIEQTGAHRLQANASLDLCLTSSSEVDDRYLATIRPSPTSTSYTTTMTRTLLDASTNVRPVFVIGYLSDLNNYYSMGGYHSGAAADAKIYKKVAGVVTNIASGDTEWANGDTLAGEFAPGSQKLLKNGSTVISATDTDLSGPGQTGLGIGNAWVSTDDIGVDRLDDFAYVESVSGIVHAPFSSPIFKSRLFNPCIFLAASLVLGI